MIIFGIGGVGSWCAESLIRSGIRKMTIVDSGMEKTPRHCPGFNAFDAGKNDENIIIPKANAVKPIF